MVVYKINVLTARVRSSINTISAKRIENVNAFVYMIIVPTVEESKLV